MTAEENPPEQVLSLADVGTLTRQALGGAGARGAQLDAGTESIVSAEAEGFRTVGLGYLPIYCAQLKAGKIDGAAVPSLAQTAPARLDVDAQNGFAHAAFLKALGPWTRLAHDQGAAVLVIQRSNSAGVLGWFSAKAAEAGLVCLGFANSSPMMPPAGGDQAFFGTNPLTLAAPRGSGQRPLIIDMASSQVAYVTIADHAARGDVIPLGWGVDASGAPTQEPSEVIEGGGVAPLGGDKGAMLALMVDVLAGGLAGPSFSYQASSIIDASGGPMGIGQTFIAIAPGSRERAPFTARLEAMLDAMLAAGGARPPGARRHAARAQAEARGVRVPAALLEEIRAYV